MLRFNVRAALTVLPGELGLRRQGLEGQREAGWCEGQLAGCLAAVLRYAKSNNPGKWLVIYSAPSSLFLLKARLLTSPLDEWLRLVYA